MSHIQQITLDLIPNGEMPILYASQYDAGRSFRANIVERKIPYNLEGTELISLTVRKGDGNLVTMDIANTFANKSYIDFLSTEQMTAIAGSNFGELHLESNGESIGTLNFYLLVEPAADEGGVSESEINNLKRQVHDAVVEELEDHGAEDTGYDNTESGLEATNVQDAIDEVNTKIDNIPAVDAYTKEQSDEKYATNSELDTVENLTTEIDTDDWSDVSLACQNGYYCYVTGDYTEEQNRKSAKIEVASGEKYRVTTVTRSTLIAGLIFFNADDEVIGYDLLGNGTEETHTNYEFVTPDNTASMVVQSSTGTEPTLQKPSGALAFKAYTKAETNALLDNKADNTRVDTLESLTTEEVPGSWENVPLTCREGYYYSVTGVWVDEVGRKSAKLNVNVGEVYKVSTYLRSVAISGIMYFNANDEFIGKDLDGTGTNVTITDYEFTIPANTAWIAVQSTNSTEPTLSKQTTTLAFKAYDKTESDNRYVQKGSDSLNLYYGVKWNLNNPDDLGARCFDAVGLSATIGVGATDGASDFDSIYPWSEIKRCNIKKNANGAEIVTFEGESGFALDGSNGDVFVRIPKFFYERYIKDGYEYRIISESGMNVHPAFIENGIVLDEIFISAFEGYIDSNNELRSIGGVIPSSNEYPQTFLTYAQANGSNYSLYDSRCVDLIFTLFAIEFACRNTNHILGYGLADFEQPATYLARDKITAVGTQTNTVRTSKWNASQKQMLPVGSNITVCDTTQQNILTQAKLTACVDGTDYTDWTFDGEPIDVDTDCFLGSAAFNTNWCESSPSGALSWHTGRNNWIANSNTKNAIRYRWIENIIGNLWHYLPDVSFNNLQMYVCKDMKDYEMHKVTGAYKPVGALCIENNDNGDKADTVGTNYWITELANDNFAKGVLFGKAYDKQLTSSKAFGGYYYLQTGNKTIANGGGFDHLYRCNITTQRAWINNTQMWYLYGARLMYKRLA